MSRPRSPTSSIFGRRMREARDRLGLPQDKLGVLIGIDEHSSSARISRYESGTHQPPVAVAKRLAEELGVPLAFLYCAEDDLAKLILHYAQLPERKRTELHSWLERDHLNS